MLKAILGDFRTLHFQDEKNQKLSLTLWIREVSHVTSLIYTQTSLFQMQMIHLATIAACLLVVKVIGTIAR